MARYLDVYTNSEELGVSANGKGGTIRFISFPLVYFAR
jgi:hypothetical protein